MSGVTTYGLARSAQSARPSLWRGICVMSCALGMGTKQVMVTAPVLAVLYDRAFLASSFGEVFRKRRGLYAALAGTWLILFFLFWVDPPIRRAGLDFERLTFGRNLLLQSVVLLHYLRLSVWPHPFLLDYSWPAAQTFRGFAPAQLGNHAGAAARFGRALALKPRDAVLHQIIGVTWARAGQWDEAVAHFEEALRLDSGSVSASKRLKDALRERDRRD